ncbi:hypothetical protein FRD01_11145 [Microvenator marinus]|uniref:Dickkopf N-terminal cysteine-rich domain-containing protein n=1 Tax=Microvenator marinus TaxID=2600177 RepID=A0A5B8XWD6_9DELT|nr:hypothetical protein [Microvenator marinus]QED27779.1 hypothetical protein FRD01_11145 [Microvenator marinus]
MRLRFPLIFFVLVACGDSAPQPSTEVFDLRQEYWNLLCQAAQSCQTPTSEVLINRYRTLDECLSTPPPSFISARLLPNTLELIEAERIEFDSASASSCLTDLSAAFCEGDIYTLPETCAKSFRGQIGAGQTCESNLECEGEMECVLTNDGCSGTCQMPCNGQCTASQFCLAGSCFELAKLAETCRGTGGCEGDLVCSNAKCVEPNSLEIGAECSSDKACVKGSQCLDGECRPWTVAKEGEPCGFGIDTDLAICEFGSLCRNITLPDGLGTCRSPGEQGSVCQWPGQCAADLTCSTLMAAESGECEALREDLAPCAADHECESGTCQAGSCASSRCLE